MPPRTALGTAGIAGAASGKATPKSTPRTQAKGTPRSATPRSATPPKGKGIPAKEPGRKNSIKEKDSIKAAKAKADAIKEEEEEKMNALGEDLRSAAGKGDGAAFDAMLAKQRELLADSNNGAKKIEALLNHANDEGITALMKVSNHSQNSHTMRGWAVSA